jgi:hypothetical protein
MSDQSQEPRPRRPTEMTVRTYAALEQVTERTVWNWRQKGAIEFRRTPGGRVRIIVHDRRR